MKKFKKLISMVISAIMLISIMSITISAAPTPSKVQIINLYDFENTGFTVGEAITSEQLAEMGIVATAGDKESFKIVEDSGKKFLAYHTESIGNGLVFKFPRDFAPREDEIIVVEYDMLTSYKTPLEAGYTYENIFNGPVGEIGFGVSTEINDGGNGAHYRIYKRGHANTLTGDLFDRRTGSEETGYTTGWNHIKATYDYGMYVKNPSSLAFSAMGTKFSAEIKNIMSGTDLNNGVLFKSSRKSVIYVDNLQVYTLRKMDIENSSIKNGAENVFVEENKIELDFTNNIATFNSVAVKVDGESFAGFEVTKKDANTLEIAFDEAFEYGANYEIDASAVVDENGLSGAKVISFTTEDEPAVLLTEYEMVENAGVFGANITLSNSAATSKNAMITLASYSENGVVREIQRTIVEIPENGERDYISAVRWDSSWGAGYVKLFVWSNDEIPYFKHITIEK